MVAWLNQVMPPGDRPHGLPRACRGALVLQARHPAAPARTSARLTSMGSWSASTRRPDRRGRGAQAAPPPRPWAGPGRPERERAGRPAPSPAGTGGAPAAQSGGLAQRPSDAAGLRQRGAQADNGIQPDGGPATTHAKSTHSRPWPSGENGMTVSGSWRNRRPRAAYAVRKRFQREARRCGMRRAWSRPAAAVRGPGRATRSWRGPRSFQ